MSLQAQSIPAIPELTVQVAHAAFRKGNVNGLVHFRARYMDPSLGIFVSLDPLETANRYGYVKGNPVNGAVGEPMSMNGYSYAHANPINFVDPSGLYGESPVNFGGSCQQSSACQGELEASEIIREGIRLTVVCGATYNGNPFISWENHSNILARVESALADVSSM